MNPQKNKDTKMMTYKENEVMIYLILSMFINLLGGSARKLYTANYSETITHRGNRHHSTSYCRVLCSQ